MQALGNSKVVTAGLANVLWRLLVKVVQSHATGHWSKSSDKDDS
ncbi:hypothetical protein CBM2634_A170113 [Cupriavidus taiwanensis]|uniref:Uncharacterized protein n=1 Tax=Cupriavidus taiwanensis TaxID=164546 RepID=A0A375J0C5_9BURK|nr:hypothetical protein CBM2634_A170113 [Cupriavidus taiwanensis]